MRDGEGHLNVYVILAERFAEPLRAGRGESEHGAVHRARGMVSALPLPGGLDIAAPWGERQTASAGYLLCNGQEVYGSSKEAFEATY